MSAPLTFTITHTMSGSHARVGTVQTPHGAFDTPAFMPVGTKATVTVATANSVINADSL